MRPPPDRFPVLPEIARSASVAAFAHPKTAGVLWNLGIRRLEDLEGRTIDELCLAGMTERGALTTLKAVQQLHGLPPGRLSRICRIVPGQPLEFPTLRSEVISAICHAGTVDQEIQGLLADASDRDRALILARWGYGLDAVPTLEDVGAAFGITRERARQIVQRKEDEVKSSGLWLPLAATLVADLDEAGGALPLDDFFTLIQYGQVPATIEAVKMLPLLASLDCIPGIRYEPNIDLWLTSTGIDRWLTSGRAKEMCLNARAVVRKHRRRTGAVPTEVMDGLSPFGRGHALALTTPSDTAFEIVSGHVVLQPGYDSALLRQCRKTLYATGTLRFEELHHGLVRVGFSVPGPVLEALLLNSGEFQVEGEDVILARPVSDAVLSPAERAGFALLAAQGGAMVWWDFIERMQEAGFSVPMANVVLKKPAVRCIGPGTYALRGREISAEQLRVLKQRRRKLQGHEVIRSVEQLGAAAIRVTYRLNRFTLQGVLPAPKVAKRLPRQWLAQFPDGGQQRIKVANGFVWNLRRYFDQVKAAPGDEFDAEFQLERCHAVLSRIRTPAQNVARSSPRSREDQIVKVLFGDSADDPPDL